ncbi:C40 family peptidase [Nocardioides sp.]|uniref:C40 family peptidase n=1 Tax=Nocardioides sp. TaxID=35761 RepID=UPI003783809C
MSRMPTITRAVGRTGVRLLASGALAVGLLSTAPAVTARGATPHHHAPHHAGHHHAGHHAGRVGSAMAVAMHQKGDPYAYGASGPGAFDCSGLVYYAFRHAGFRHVPRTSSAQAHFAHHISRSHMKRGDLMFFHDGGGVYHVGIYAGFKHGHRMVLHAPYPGQRVHTERVWTDAWFPGTLRR